MKKLSKSGITVSVKMFSFLWAQNALFNSLDKNLEWLIIDEIGPLELEGKGLEPARFNNFK